MKRRKVERDTSDDIEDGTSFFGVPFFSYKELEEATHHFDPAKELGDGGFGTVYYGTNLKIFTIHHLALHFFSWVSRDNRG